MPCGKCRGFFGREPKDLEGDFGSITICLFYAHTPHITAYNLSYLTVRSSLTPRRRRPRLSSISLILHFLFVPLSKKKYEVIF